MEILRYASGMTPPYIYLVSQSPRRAALLKQIGISFHTLLIRDDPRHLADVDETPLINESATDYVQRVCLLKAEAAWESMIFRNLPPAPVLAADTTLLSITAVSFATSTFTTFQGGNVILASEVNANFQNINDQIASLAAAVSNVQAVATLDATTKANAAQAAALAQAAQLYQPKYGTSGWVDVTPYRGTGGINHNGNTPRVVQIYFVGGSLTFTSSTASDLLSNFNDIGPFASANNGTQTIGSYIVPPNQYYRIVGGFNKWYEYSL